uniref:Tropomyosin n=1 Tax=Anopheles farauti TaxID=69004 RepID=A0A182QGP9_9DIPT
MDAIKKKMQAMKLEKDNALDRALLCEQQARDANLRAEKAEEEARQLQKKIQAIENDLDQTQETLMQVNTKLEEKEKALQNFASRQTATMIGIMSYGNRKRRADCCSRPKQTRNSGNKQAGKRKQHSKKERHSRRQRDYRPKGRRRRRRRGSAAALGGGGGSKNKPAPIDCGNRVAAAPAALTAGETTVRAKTPERPLVTTVGTDSVSVTAAKKQDVVAAPHRRLQGSLSSTEDEEDVVVVVRNPTKKANGAAGDGDGVGASNMCENNSGPGPGTGGRKRGHQHHPRFGGTRQSTVPAEDVIAALRGAFDGGSNSLSSSSLSSSASSLIVSVGGASGGGGASGTVTDGSNNNNLSGTERTTIAKQSDDNDADLLLDDFEITAAATADIVNSNIENSSITTVLGPRWSGDPSKENTPEPEQDLLNNNRSISSSTRSSVSPKNVILLDEVADAGHLPVEQTGSTITAHPADDEESIKLKLDQITSGKELVQQINKKLKRSKRSPQADDGTGATSTPSGKKKSSSTGKKSSSKTTSSSSSGADGTKRKKSKSSAAAAAAATAAPALEKRASGDGASYDLDAVIGGILGAGEGSGLMGDYKDPPNDENDPDVAEWAKLRCTSERTEVIAEREHRRQKRCADYPGLAFGRSIFSSDTMMKFNIIRNELHNIMKTQLKRIVKDTYAPEDRASGEQRPLGAVRQVSRRSYF